MRWKEEASKFRREERYAMPRNSGHPILLCRSAVAKSSASGPCVTA